MGMVFVSIVEYFVLLAYERYGMRMCSDIHNDKSNIGLRKAMARADPLFLQMSPVIFAVFCLVYLVGVMRY